jgi:hypothetical protein
MNCHQDIEVCNFFGAQSYFVPYEEPDICPLEDSEHPIIKEEKKNKGVKYLPGEKLLIQIGKGRKKDKKKDKKKSSNCDIDKISSSLSRVLRGFS